MSVYLQGKKYREQGQILQPLAACFLIIKILLEKPDLKVLDVRTQVFVENLLNCSVRLDILATDSTGAKLKVEVQRSDKGAGRLKMVFRFNF